MSRKRQKPILYPHGQPGAALTTLSWDYGAGENVPPHFHLEDQLVFASQGVMIIRTKQGVWFVPPQKAVWIPGKIVHSIQIMGMVSMRTLYFAPRFVKAMPRKCMVMNVSTLLRELILHACGLKRLSVQVARELHVLELIVDQLDTRERVPLQLPMPTDPRALRLAETLMADPSDARSFQELCDECGASKRTIERLFQEQTALTVGKWRQQLRMLMSLDRLVAGEKVIHVAMEMGYDSPSAFVSAFRKVLGSTPSQWS